MAISRIVCRGSLFRSIMIIAMSVILISHSAWGQNYPGNPTTKLTRMHRLYEIYEDSARSGYKLFLQPTPPPKIGVKAVIPEFSKTSFLVLVYDSSDVFTELVREAARVVPVLVLVSDVITFEQYIGRLDFQLRTQLLSGRVRLLLNPTTTIWIRDFGPIYTRLKDGTIAAMDPIYIPKRETVIPRCQDEQLPYFLGSELGVSTYRPPLILSGGNFAADGKGLCFTSMETIVENGGNEEDVDSVFKAFFGCDEVVYLEPLPGPTTAHIDMFFRVADSGTYLLGSYEKPRTVSSGSSYLQLEAYRRMERNDTTLREVIDRRKMNVRIVRIPMPDIALRTECEAAAFGLSEDYKYKGTLDTGTNDLMTWLLSELQDLDPHNCYQTPYEYRTFLNFIHIRSDSTEVVFIPSYEDSLISDPVEVVVKDKFSRIYPHARLVFVNCTSLIAAQGALHCISLVLPEDVGKLCEGRFPVETLGGTPIPSPDLAAEWPKGDQVTADEVRKEYQTILLIDRMTKEDSLSGEVVSGFYKSWLWEKAIDSLIDRHGIRQTAKTLNVISPSPVVVDSVARMLGQNLWSDERLRQYFYEAAIDSLLLSSLANIFAKDTVISNAAVDSFYEQNPDSFLVGGTIVSYLQVNKESAEDNFENVYDESTYGFPVDEDSDTATSVPSAEVIKCFSDWLEETCESESDASYQEYPSCNGWEVEDFENRVRLDEYAKDLVPDSVGKGGSFLYEGGLFGGYYIIYICSKLPLTRAPLDLVRVEIRELLIKQRNSYIKDELRKKWRRGLKEYDLPMPPDLLE
jgi:agmatine/peptidylarginine deiminase